MSITHDPCPRCNPCPCCKGERYVEVPPAVQKRRRMLARWDELNALWHGTGVTEEQYTEKRMLAALLGIRDR